MVKTFLKAKQIELNAFSLSLNFFVDISVNVKVCEI